VDEQNEQNHTGKCATPTVAAYLHLFNLEMGRPGAVIYALLAMRTVDATVTVSGAGARRALSRAGTPVRIKIGHR